MFSRDAFVSSASAIGIGWAKDWDPDDRVYRDSDFTPTEAKEAGKFLDLSGHLGSIFTLTEILISQ